MQNILVSIIESYIDRKLGLGSDSKKSTKKSSSSHKSHRRSHSHSSPRRSLTSASSTTSTSSTLPRTDSFDSIFVAKRRSNSTTSSAASARSIAVASALPSRGRTLFHNSSSERSPSPSPSSRRSHRRSSSSSVVSHEIDEQYLVRQRRPSDFFDDELALAGLPSLSSDEPWRATACYNRHVARRA